MASQITFSSIDENYPVAGQDNVTQGFRDNFNVIKQALLKASEEITTLQQNTEGLELSALAGGNGTNFNGTFLTGAVLKGNAESLVSGGTVTGTESELNIGNGNYQVFQVGASSVTFNITGFSAIDEGANKIVLELTGDDVAREVSFASNDPGIVSFKRSNFPAGTFTVTSSTNPILLEIYSRKKNTEPGLLSRTIFINYIGQFE